MTNTTNANNYVILIEVSTRIIDIDSILPLEIIEQSTVNQYIVLSSYPPMQSAIQRAMQSPPLPPPRPPGKEKYIKIYINFSVYIKKEPCVLF